MDTHITEVGREEAVKALEAYLERYKGKRDEGARSLGVSRICLWKMLTGRKPLSNKILEKVGYKRQTTQVFTYVPIGENDNHATRNKESSNA